MRVLMVLATSSEDLPERLAAEGYEVIAADGVDSARSVIDAEHVDGVIVDVSGDDGPLRLLRHVEETAPQVLRVARCRLEDARAVTAAIDVAHQVLARPCTPAALARAVEDAALIRRILGDERLDEIVGGAERLPQPPRSAFEVYRLAAEGDLDGMCHLVEKDPSLTARVLRAVNTPYFGLPRTVSTVRDAAVFLGSEYLSALVVGEGVADALDSVNARVARLAIDVQQRGQHAAGFVRALGEGLRAPRSLVGAAFTAAVLRDVGLLVLAVADAPGVDSSPAAMGELLEKRHIPELGVTVGQLGAYLLGVWNLPDVVVAGVAGHEEQPRVLPDDEPGPVDLVHVASVLADRGGAAFDDPSTAAMLSALGLETIARNVLSDQNA